MTAAAARLEPRDAVVAFEGVRTTFAVANSVDHIQGFHARGQYYELRQLLAHRDLIPMHATILDVGANIGNHTLFYARHTWAGRIYPFEPNPAARRLLERNVAMNRDGRVPIDMSFSSLAAGRRRCSLQIGREVADNLGATTLVVADAADGGALECVRLDDLRFEGQVGFVKIDVEGMELDVLAGAEELLEKFRPAIAVEVAVKNQPEFGQWLRSARYQIVLAFRDYVQTWNYLVVPTP